MSITPFLKAACGVACIAFSLHGVAQTSGTAPSASSETMGQRLDDGTITTKVKAELLAANNVKSTGIHVQTRMGIVWLTGTVPTADDKVAAQDVAQTVSDVKGVKNHLKVEQ